MTETTVSRTAIVKLVAAAFVLRVFVGILTPIPAEDAANYLWMAQRFAAGATGDALSEVFPPGLPLLLAPIVATGVDPFRGAQWVAALLAALALWPCVRIAETVDRRFALATGLLLACVPLSVRFVGQLYTEPVFALFAAWSLRACLAQRHFLAGVAAAAAFWLRPEALALPFASLWLGRARGLATLPPFAIGVLGLALWRSSSGQPFDVLPKLEFNALRGDAAVDDTGLHVGTLFDNLLALPGAWLEAFWVVGLLGVWGAWRMRREPRARAFGAVLAIVLIAILGFLTRRRFLVAWVPVLALFVPTAFAAMRERARFPVLFVGGLLAVLGCLKLEPPDRYDEAVVGEWLAGMLAPGETVAGDMTRIIWYAGSRPLPPRHFGVDELVERAREPGVRFVALARRRAGREQVAELLASEFSETGLPERERRAVERRGILLLERRR